MAVTDLIVLFVVAFVFGVAGLVAGRALYRRQLHGAVRKFRLNDPEPVPPVSPAAVQRAIEQSRQQ